MFDCVRLLMESTVSFHFDSFISRIDGCNFSIRGSLETSEESWQRARAWKQEYGGSVQNSRKRGLIDFEVDLVS